MATFETRSTSPVSTLQTETINFLQVGSHTEVFLTWKEWALRGNLCQVASPIKDTLNDVIRMSSYKMSTLAYIKIYKESLISHIDVKVVPTYTGSFVVLIKIQYR